MLFSSLDMRRPGFARAVEVAREAGIPLRRTPVGDRYVVEEMRRSGCLIGGEQSGHIVFLDFQTTGDGILTALEVSGLDLLGTELVIYFL